MLFRSREAVRINTINWNDVPEVITLKPDPHHWPNYELRREGYEWRRRELVPAPEDGVAEAVAAID